MSGIVAVDVGRLIAGSSDVDDLAVDARLVTIFGWNGTNGEIAGQLAIPTVGLRSGNAVDIDGDIAIRVRGRWLRSPDLLE